MKDNTLRNEIEQIITDETAGDIAMHALDGSVDAILLAIKNRLPKEKDHTPQLLPNGKDVNNYQYFEGWDDCLSEVKQALDIESES